MPTTRPARKGRKDVWNEVARRELADNLVDERSSGWMYRTLARIDTSPERVRTFEELADFEEDHAAAWERLLGSIGAPLPRRRRLLEHRLLVSLARTLGVGAVVPILHKMEVDGIEKYLRQARQWDSPAAREAFTEILADEVAHEVDMFAALRQTGESEGGLRSAVLGSNDGLGSVLALATGVAGATMSSPLVLIAGLAGLVAGAVSMAASSYVSIRGEQDSVLAQRRLVKFAVALAPEVKKDQLREAYESEGLPPKLAEAVAERLARRKETFERALLVERHKITDQAPVRPARLAAITGISFAAAAAIPLLPFLLLQAQQALLLSVGLTAVALFASGIIRALITLGRLLRSGLELVAAGMGSAAATYLVGVAVGGLVTF